MKAPATQLWEVAAEIDRLSKDLYNCWYEEQTGRLKDVQQSSQNLLAGVMAGIRLGEETK